MNNAREKSLSIIIDAYNKIKNEYRDQNSMKINLHIIVAFVFY